MINETKWFYYNHAVFPDCPPHAEIDTQKIESGEIWKEEGKKAILARFITDFDCGQATGWWYILKDDPFDINTLKSKHRYKINRGRNHFRFERINPKDYVEDLFRVQTAAYNSYPKKYRPSYTKDDMVAAADRWASDGKTYVFASFFRETGLLCGYSVIIEKQNCLYYSVLKVDPEYEHLLINYELVADVLEFFSDKLESDYYITNGERNVQHETNFQELLERYFGYRKAYCKLNVVYNPKYEWIVKVLFVFRKVIKVFDNVRIAHKINGVLKMEEIVRFLKKGEVYE